MLNFDTLTIPTPECSFYSFSVVKLLLLVTRFLHASSEYGISRSVTVVLAYLMWSEGRSFQLLHDELKEKKPEVRSVSHRFKVTLMVLSFLAIQANLSMVAQTS